VVDRRGLTAFGAVVLIFGLGTLGGAYDLASGTGLRTVFAVCFVLGCAVTALTVHREDLLAVVVMPPLIYLALAGGAALLQHARTGSLLTQQAIELANAVVISAPVLLLGTAVAAVLAVVRGIAGRHRR
jgi:hypothetical protein